MEKMFCYQCQEAAKGTGCTLKGVCGKEATTSNAMDLLLYSVKGISYLTTLLRKNNKSFDSQRINRWIQDALFSTITNANFDEESIKGRIAQSVQIREELKTICIRENITIPAHKELHWNATADEYDLLANTIRSIKAESEDIHSLMQLTLFGLKGMAAYAEHAARLGYTDDSIDAFIQSTLALWLDNKLSTEEWIALVLETGKYGVKTMALLDKANTETYGNPELTEVSLDVRNRPGILISGHDLKDMEELLEQTKNTGVDIYTHSEMLPANYYPKFKKYDHFVGNYGNAWWKQREEFTTFNGPILFTTNCIVPPLKNATYKDKVFTTNATGYPGFKHITTDNNGKKDFSEIIALAKTCEAPQSIEKGTLVGGFAHHQVLALADKVVDAVKQGAIKQFVVMAGCDGRMSARGYYTDFANELPKDTVILTAGCAKYRYNKLNLGDISGIPRVLDAGQCNDSYSLAVIAMKLQEVFGLDDINDLPIVYNIAWYEQKAVIVLLALLSLGVKNIHLGPTLPAFLSPNVLNVLVENFGITGISDVKNDMENWISA